MQMALANNFNTALSAGLSSNGGSVTVTSTVNLPTLATGQAMPVTLNDLATRTKYEICYVTAISGSTLTLARAQEGTTAQVWNARDFIFCTATAGVINFFRLGGPTASRPLTPFLWQPYFDTTLGQPIWCNSTSPVTWVNSAGVQV